MNIFRNCRFILSETFNYLKMKIITIFGAGLSASTLIQYLLNHSTKHNWKIRVGDISEELAAQKINHHPNGYAFAFNLFDNEQKEREIQGADAVISMLPARFHPIVAECCVRHKTHMLTASYVSKEMKELDTAAREAGIAMLNELGVDPGIDHMSAMRIIDKIKAKGGKLNVFKSSTGGLIAPEYDNNPWNYKFTWNPRNVVVAGQGISQYLENGSIKYIPYHRLFERVEHTLMPNIGEFEIYPNRDSVSYRDIYQLRDIETIFRGTMRRPGYCKAWNVFVQLGMTDDTYTLANSETLTYRQFLASFMPHIKKQSLEEAFASLSFVNHDKDIISRFKWLDMFENHPIKLNNASPAQILQQILEQKWILNPNDKDMITMQHLFEYELNGERKGLKSSLVVIGKDTTHTAMSITVGTPLAIAAKLLLTGKFTMTGVHVPTQKEMYLPILKELKKFGIHFTEEEYTPE